MDKYKTPTKEQWASFDIITKLTYLYLYWKTMYKGQGSWVDVSEATKNCNILLQQGIETVNRVLSGEYSFDFIDNDLILIKNDKKPEWMES